MSGERGGNGLENKIAMLTGATRGISRAFAEAYVRDEAGGVADPPGRSGLLRRSPQLPEDAAKSFSLTSKNRSLTSLRHWAQFGRSVLRKKICVA